MTVTMRSAPRAVRWAFAALVLWMAAYEAFAVLAPGDGLGGVFGKQVHLGVLVAGALVCLARALMVREERGTWALVAAALMAWSGGEIYYTQVIWGMKSPPVPSLADAGYLLMPVLLFVAICRLARRRLRRAAPALWADGVTAALAVGALSAAVAFDAAIETVGGDPLMVATNLAYPVSDLLLLGLCVAVVALNGWRLDRTWALLAGGVTLFWIADSLYLVQTAHGTYTAGGVYDVGWWAGIAAIAGAAWQPIPETARDPHERGTWTIGLPVGFCVLALGVLAYGSLRQKPLNGLAVGLAVASLLTICMRLVITFRAHAAMLRTSRREALTDALTGLPNRRALITDLDTAFERATDGDPLTLVLFDLDGFKLYNDTFGHQAGDALLARLAASLETFLTARGKAYRVGGDEFCALIRPGSEVADPIVRGAATALSEQGEGFRIRASWGVVTLPREAASPSEALRTADQRMYGHKHDRRPTVGRQTADVLLRVLAERDPGLNTHAHDVAELARATARHLGLGDEQIELVAQAGQLHDIGKLAIPDAILAKPSALDADEWAFVRRHTLIGERILAVAPDLGRVARVVRASHEHFDGSGYPDGLAGHDIPLAARIVSVCDAFDAMVADRPYAVAMSPRAAEQELRRCAASQFDPVVVEGFCAARLHVLAERAAA
jgi:diguanylate cyclase (GGDEF)-like protein